MVTANDIMPPHSGAAEKALVDGVIVGFDFDIRVGDVWSPERAPAAVLPWLAWALSVDDWDEAWSEERKRAVIAASVEVHRHKGTVGSMKQALQSMGYGDARIIEAGELPRYGKLWPYGKSWTYGPSDPSWADYWVEVPEGISVRDAGRIAERLRSIAPARCRLRAVTLAGVFFVYGDGLWTYGKDVTYGGVYQFGG